MPNDTTVQSSNYTLLKLIRTGASPLFGMIGTSAYYGQLIGNPILGSINALLFSKKLGIDIWNLNQMPNAKTKLLNSSKKILLGLGTIGLANYSKFTETINPITPTTTTTETPPWPAVTLSVTNDNINAQSLMDWDTYISLNSYGIANLIAGITEIIPNKFETIRKIANMATGGCLISSGIAMGINNNFSNAYAVPTIVAGGASEIIHNLLPMETNHHVEEMQETTFTSENTRLINDVMDRVHPVFRPTTTIVYKGGEKLMNKEKIIEYYTEIIKLQNKEAEQLQKKLDELIISVSCYHKMVEKIKNGEFDKN